MNPATLATAVLLFTLSRVVKAAKERGQPCRARHPSRDDVLTAGQCVPLPGCLESLKGIKDLKFPVFCGVSDHLLIVCCPENDVSTPLHPPQANGSTSCETDTGEPGSCLPLDDCDSLADRVRQRMFPPLCDIKGGKAFACCPLEQRSGAILTVDPPTAATTVQPMDRNNSTARILAENSRYCGKPLKIKKSRRDVLSLRDSSRDRYTPYVVGGRSVYLGQYPFMVALFRNQVNVRNFWCGGTLIAAKVVLSAAHCFYKSQNDTVYVARIGGISIADASRDPSLQRTVVAVHVHPDYDERLHYSDIALLILDHSALQTWAHQPLACLPDYGVTRDESTATVLGWGHNAFGGRVQTILQEASVPIISNDECDKAYQNLGSYKTKLSTGINDHFVCAGNTSSGGVDACQMDSGGPLIVRSSQDGTTFVEVVGVVSFGVGCGSPAYPGVYTRVSTFANWILDSISDVEQGLSLS